jgi:cysteinyl-tRNA synthetase
MVGVDLVAYVDSRKEMSPEERLALEDAWVAATIHALIEKREEARRNKNYAVADEIRDAFARAGVILNDTPEGLDWTLGGDFDAAKLEGLLT